MAKRKPRKQTPRTVEHIRWVDSFGLPAGWQDMEEAVCWEPVEITSVGTVLRDEKKYVVIAGNWSEGENGQFGGVLAIPKASIVRRRTLR